MTDAHAWLDRLAEATDYRQLQDLFASMAADARTSDAPHRIVSSIDEAIERLRRERARDEDELRAMEVEYEDFKKKQGGVFGWVKRHTPFTETRRRDKEHQAEVETQEAEILADNLVIARAQLLKETVLPAAERRIGADREDWRRRLASSDDIARVRPYAEAVVALRNEIRGARAVLAEIEADIDAFARADFKDDADRRRKKTDLAAARSYLESLEQELGQKDDLVTEAVARLRALIADELAAHDPSFARRRRAVT